MGGASGVDTGWSEMKNSYCRSIAIIAITVALLPIGARLSAQGDPTQSVGRQANSPMVKPWFSLTGEYDNNVFLLSSSRGDAVNSPSSADVASRRYADMKQAEDIIARVAGGISLRTSGLGGRDLTLLPTLEYNNYTRNAERSFFTAALVLQQALAHSARLRLSAAYTPNYFAKNYLARVVDSNSDGSISPAERRYESGRYSESEYDVGYRFRIRKGTRKSPLAARMEVGGGYYSRSYDAPFQSRDLRGPTVSTALDFEPSRSLGFGLAYKLAKLSADPAREVLILDEPAVGADLNGNRRSTDLSVGTEQIVDRSRTEHEARANAQMNMTGRTAIRLIYGLRLRNYTSRQQFDLGHRDRRDIRNEVGGELLAKVTQSLRFTGGARYSIQRSDRSLASDPSGDNEDYSRLRAYAGIRFDIR